MTPNWRRRTLLALALMVFGTAGYAVAQPGPRPAGGTWPIRVTYDLTYQRTAESMATSTFEWTANSLFDWKQAQLCCGFEEGSWIQLKANGEVWSAGPGGHEPSLIMKLEPDNGMVPHPDFAPRYPTTIDELRAAGALLIGDPGVENPRPGMAIEIVGRDLGLATADLLSYEIRVNQVETAKVVYAPLNLLLRLRETENGILIRELVVTRVEFLPDW